MASSNTMTLQSNLPTIGRRQLLGGVTAIVASDTSATHAATLVHPPASVAQVPDRASLVAFQGELGQAVLLEERGRSGLFVLRDGRAPVGDELEGLSIQSGQGVRHWERQWDGVNAKPEWFGAKANVNSSLQAKVNRIAIQACFALCPRTVFEAGTYFIDSTLQFNTSFRQAIGVGPSWDGAMSGTRIISKDNSRDAVLIGTYGPQHGANDMEFENLLAGWELPRAPRGTALGTPVAWHVEHNTSCQLRKLSAYNVTIGFFFYATVYCKVISCRVYRDALFGGRNDFFIGMWVRGLPASSGFAGGNASLYVKQFSAALARPGAGFMPLLSATGILADGDFADLYLEEIETAAVAFPIVIDGEGGRNGGGNGDLHIRNVVLDQIIGDGITVRNTNELTKVQINGGYIQVVDSQRRNKGLWFQNGGGQITVANLQITGEDNSKTSIGIYLKDRPNVAISDTVIVENIAFPITAEKSCPRLSLACTINSGRLPPANHAAMTVDGASQSVFRPKITGKPGAWTAGIELLGAAHDRVAIEPTMVDPASVSPGRKVVVNGKPIGASGYYTSAGDRSREGTGISVTGIVG